MSVKIRLSRHGKKGYAFFHIVATDIRAPRDSRFIELLGSYNPNSNPATIILDVDRAVYWLQNGAQPTTTVRRILSYKGALLKKHLIEGVRKGALTEEQAEEKFKAWVAEKEAKIAKKAENLATSKREAKRVAIEAESKVNSARAEELAKKKVAQEKAAEKAAEKENEEVVGEEQVAEEAPKEETPQAE